MTQSDQSREDARRPDGRFGEQAHSQSEVGLDPPTAPSANPLLTAVIAHVPVEYAQDAADLLNGYQNGFPGADEMDEALEQMNATSRDDVLRVLEAVVRLPGARWVERPTTFQPLLDQALRRPGAEVVALGEVRDTVLGDGHQVVLGDGTSTFAYAHELVLRA